VAALSGRLGLGLDLLALPLAGARTGVTPPRCCRESAATSTELAVVNTLHITAVSAAEQATEDRLSVRPTEQAAANGGPAS
jgi:hypothetical protein